jgi:hypothetical protein
MKNFRNYIIDNCCVLNIDFENSFILYKSFIEILKYYKITDFNLLDFIDESLTNILFDERNT